MPSFNKIIIVGHLGRDPELRYTPNGKAVADFTVATSERFKDEEVTTWFKVTLWGKLAENASRYFSKGSAAYIEGRLSHEEWTDRDGKTRTTFLVNGSDIKFITPKADGVSAGTAELVNHTLPVPADDDIPF